MNKIINKHKGGIKTVGELSALLNDVPDNWSVNWTSDHVQDQRMYVKNPEGTIIYEYEVDIG